MLVHWDVSLSFFIIIIIIFFFWGGRGLIEVHSSQTFDDNFNQLCGSSVIVLQFIWYKFVYFVIHVHFNINFSIKHVLFEVFAIFTSFIIIFFFRPLLLQ